MIWSESDLEDVLPETNQRSSAITARWGKKDFVVRRSKTGLNCVGSSEEGRERVNRSATERILNMYRYQF
jgi:hypothetical protein